MCVLTSARLIRTALGILAPDLFSVLTLGIFHGIQPLLYLLFDEYSNYGDIFVSVVESSTSPSVEASRALG